MRKHSANRGVAAATARGFRARMLGLAVAALATGGALVLAAPAMATPASPASCADVAAAHPGAGDGTYTIVVEGTYLQVYCSNMAGTPNEYITLAQTGSGQNYSEYAAGANSPGTNVVTKYTKLRINPVPVGTNPLTFAVNIADETFSSSTGSLNHAGQGTIVTSMPYAVAMGCSGPSGTANLNLSGTPFGVVNSFKLGGFVSYGTTTFVSPQEVDLTGNGHCGWNGPGNLYNPFNTNPLSDPNGAGGYDLDIQLIGSTTTAYTGPRVILAGAPATLSGRVTDAAGHGIANEPLTLSAAGRSCTATTNDSGAGSCTVTASSTLGPVTVSASFAANGPYQGSTTGPVSGMQFAFPANGAFLLGDQTVAAAGQGATLTWFGSGWAQANSVSGDVSAGSLGAPADLGFDGFASSVSGLPTSTPPATCSGTWSTAPPVVTSLGSTASPPPATVPSYMGVLVTSQVTGAVGNYSGNYDEIVVVRTKPGYTGNPGVAGTGAVVGIYCSDPVIPQSRLLSAANRESRHAHRRRRARRRSHIRHRR